MHGNFTHLFFNMFALWMFGKVLENVWGAKRFLIFYIITGIGAAIIHLGVTQYEIQNLQNQLDPYNVQKLLNEGKSILDSYQNYSHPIMGKLNLLINTPTVGASGAIFGIAGALLVVALYIGSKYNRNQFNYDYSSLLFFIGFNIVYGFKVAGIDNAAHLGGLLFGAVFGVIFVLIKEIE